jgi:hypothetical protein
MENYNPIKENWEALKLELKKRYPQLTDGDLELVEGYEFETFKNLEAKTGKNEEDFMAELKSILREQ